ncbi:MAG: aconitase X catalytic domain-containing protein, partial [Candidatus Hydrothermarchaeaceae archaeon]
EEEGILDGEEGEGAQKAIEILVALGDINGAEKLVEISGAQISGVSYKTIGDAGLAFLSDWASKGARIKVPATLNPAGVDIERWKELNYPPEFAGKQLEILRAYEDMGATASCTCTPYLAGNKPGFGSTISWAESSSVIFANSVLGARTNRESGISALAAAIIGKTSLHGLHLTENRLGTLNVEIEKMPANEAEYAAIGYYIGKNYRGIPVFNNIKPSMEELKIMGAALATGSISMFHVRGVTPEYTDTKAERIQVGKEEIEETFESLSTCDDAEVVCIGCPHCSLKEVEEALRQKTDKEVWIFTARKNRDAIEKYRGNKKVIYDTCMVVSPMEEMGIRSIGTNSAKAAFYSLNLSGMDVKFDSMEGLLK